MSLDNHYLLFVENEDNATHTGQAGEIDMYFDLSGQSLGSNGYLVLRQKNITPNQYAVNPAATDLVNTSSGGGFGVSTASSSIGAWQQGGGEYGMIENSGFTAMLIESDGLLAPPVLTNDTFDLDNGNNGLDSTADDYMNWRDHWTILDLIGVHSEEGEAAYGRLYGAVNFGRKTWPIMSRAQVTPAWAMRSSTWAVGVTRPAAIRPIGTCRT